MTTDLPFTRGETWYNGAHIDTSNLGGVNIEGKEYDSQPNAPDDTNQFDPSGRPITLKVVRNRSGISLKPGLLAHFDISGTYPLETGVDGYTDAAVDLVAGVIDEFLPPAGVPPNDLCYLVIRGPSLVQTPASGSIAISVGSTLVPAAGTSRTSADSGFATKVEATETVADNRAQVGRAGAACTTVSTQVPVVVHINF
jgi:hypothetical protein